MPNNTWGYGFARLPAPAPAPSPEPTPTTDSCVETLTGSTTVSGSWTSDCLSVEPAESGSGDRFARFYAFALAEATDVTVTLTSAEDTYLYLREGIGAGGRIVASNDDVVYGNTNSEMEESLSTGDYTIEATTYNAETAGDFTLTVVIGGSSAPPPSPEPPPDYNIEDAACNEDDLTLGGYEHRQTPGPDFYQAGYYGITAKYYNFWYNPDSPSVLCDARQYDNIHNARWHGLNYSGVVQNFALSAFNILEHEQMFVSSLIGDDLLALRLDLQHNETGENLKLVEVRFFNASTLTVSTVRVMASNYDTDTGLEIVEGVARRIAARVMPQDDTASQGHSQGYRQSLGFLEVFE